MSKIRVKSQVIAVKVKQAEEKPPGEPCILEILSFGITDGKIFNLYGLPVKINGNEYKAPVMLRVISGRTYSLSVPETVVISHETLQFVKWVVNGREIKEKEVTIDVRRDMKIEVYFMEL